MQFGWPCSLSPPVCLCTCQQAQHSHHVIQQVLNHLDTHNKDTPRVRAGIVQVLLETVAIAAKGSVGELAPGKDELHTCFRDRLVSIPRSCRPALLPPPGQNNNCNIPSEQV